MNGVERVQSRFLPQHVRVYSVRAWPREAVVCVGPLLFVAQGASPGVTLLRARRALRSLGLLQPVPSLGQ